MPMATITGPISLARKMDVGMGWMSCPFAGMTRIRFKGFPRYLGGSLSSLPELPSEQQLM
jgi:hypothetical protein